jgi:hypothetical protein
LALFITGGTHGAPHGTTCGLNEGTRFGTAPVALTKVKALFAAAHVALRRNKRANNIKKAKVEPPHAAFISQ